MATPDTLGAGDVEVLGASDVEVQGAKAPTLSASDVDVLSPNDVEMQGGAQPQPKAPAASGFPDLSRVAGAVPGMGRPATAAQVAGRRTPQPESVTQALADPITQHNEAASTFGDHHEPTLQERQDAAGANYNFDPLKGVGDVARGARKISEGVPTFGANPEFGVFPTKEQKAAPVNASTAAEGANEVLGGTMEAGTGAFGEALARKPIQTALSLAAGYVSGDVAAVAAKKAGATPEEQEFAKTLAFFIPNAVATAAGVRTTEVSGPNGTRGRGVSAFGGRVGVGGIASDEAVGVGGRVGPFSAQVVKPRGGGVEFSSNGPTRLPDPGTSLAQDEARATTQAIQQADALDAAAKNVIQGKPPIPQPPESPKPEGMEQGVLKPETVQRVAQAISMAPAAARGQLVMEAHERLANWIAQQGRVMGPDGKIAIAKTPEQAQTIAAKWINDEVARQDQARNEAKKAQENSAKVQAQQNQQPEKSGIPAQPPTLQQRAQTLIESSEKEKPEQVAKNIVRTLGIRYADALDMVKQARAGKASSIETGGLSITPEQKQAIDTQMDALKRGDVKAIHLPPESGYVPALPEGIKRVDVRKGGPGAGTYLYKAGEIRAQTIRAAAEAGTHEDLLAGKPLETSDVEVQPATTAKVEAPPAQPERRADLARRQRVAEMSPEQLQRELLTSEKTGLPNRRAFDEAEHAQPAGAVAQSDADGLKALNDKFGYAAGDALLKAKAEVLQDAGLEAYHEKGDEFLYRGETPEALQQKLDQAREKLRNREFRVTMPDGSTRILKGVDFSYGAGRNLQEAESGLKAHKSEREQRGERARGELRGITEVAPGQPDQSRAAAAEEVKPTKYEYGNTQAAVPEGSEAHTALANARAKIDKADLISTGYGGNDEGLETEPHITLRYGLKGDDTAGIRAYLEKQAPFEAALGKTTSFPPSKSSDGGAPIIAPVEAPELRRIESELDRHGDFIDRTFPEYKPHATLAYVKPEAAKKYEGMTETEGKRFRVESIEISNRDGSKETVPLKGKASEGENGIRPAAEGAGGPAAPREGAGAEKPAAEAERPGQPESAVGPKSKAAQSTVAKGGRGESPEPHEGALKPGARVSFTDRNGKKRSGTLKAMTPNGTAVVKPDDGGQRAYVPPERIEPFALTAPPEDIGVRQYIDTLPRDVQKYARAAYDFYKANGYRDSAGFERELPENINPMDFGVHNVDDDELDNIRYRLGTLATQPKEAQNGPNGAGEPQPAGEPEAGGGRPAADTGGEDRSRLEPAPEELLPRTAEEGNAAEGNPANSPDVRGNAAPVPEQGVESGSGAGSDTELDSAPAGRVAKQASKELAKPKVLNKGWYSHPEAWRPPSGTVGKLEANLKAIRILRDVEKSPRKLTDDEREALANYVGWGALQHAFDPWGAPRDEQSRWRAANQELQKLLTPDELARAQESTKNAHYTSPEMVRFMWDTMQRFGFRAGNVLEPAVGTGNFLGMMPKALRTKVNAVINEMDTVSFGIARLLYPEATAFNKDFAELILPDNDVDLAIGNPPFGDYKLYDPKYKKMTLLVHDFFFVKSLDKVRPGGILAFITSTGTLDKMNPTVREVLASKADFLGAVRLPSGAFKANAGTDVTTDLIFLQKRAAGQVANHRADWINSVPTKLPGKYGATETLNVNEYYQAHPEMMLGKPTASTKMYGSLGFLLEPHPDKNIVDLLKEAQKNLPRGIYSDRAIQQATGITQATTGAEFAPDTIKEGQYTIDAKGALKQRVEGKLVNPEAVLDKAGKPVLSKIQRFKALVGVRDAMNQLLYTMSTVPDDEDGNKAVADFRSHLERKYKAFVKQYGYLNGVANNAFRDDPHYPRLLALENWDKAARQGTPADIFRRRTIFPREELKALPDDPKAAFQLVLADRGFPDVQTMARLRGIPVEQAVSELQDHGLIYRNPATGQYETRETYLSGYVRDKLRDAKAAVAQGMKEYEPNVAALEKVVPADVEIGDDPTTSVAVRLGSTWIPTDAIRDFIRDAFKTRSEVKYIQGNWSVQNTYRTAETQAEFGTPRLDAAELLQLTLNLKQAMVYDHTPDGSVLNRDATTAAQAAQEKIRQAFQKWSVRSEWKAELQRLYNDAYNNLAQVEYDGAHLTFPGMNPAITLKAHQVNAIWRILQEGRALLAHEVGAGKTFEMAASIMEARRIGVFRKPMLTVPNHIVEQFRQEFLHLYPGANLLVPGEKDFDAKNRQRIMSRIATGDYDAIILPHSQFNLMDISPERQRVTIQKQKQELRETIEALKAEGEKRTIKQLENAMAKLDAKLKSLNDLKADRAIYFDDTGVDTLFVDEAHMYKNLTFYTKMTRIAGLQQANAKSALRLKMKTEYLQDRNHGRGVIFATGTPVQNTMAELYTMFKYVAPDVMEKAGIRFFDDWAANFGSVITAMELSADGRSYKPRSKFAQFQNVPELMNMFRSFADIKTAQDLDLPTPELETGKPIVVSVPASSRLERFVEHLMERAESVRGGRVDPKDDNMLKITTDGRKAATDMRLIDPDLPDDADSKINLAVDKMYEEWREGKDAAEGPLTQMAFLDLYRSIEGGGIGPDGKKFPEKELINLYNDMRNKLVARGVPREQIAVIGEHDTRAKRQELFARTNRGEVRILLGSTFKMGAGTNAQRLLKALHHIDLTWRPGDLAQRNGRIMRQGNLNKSVREYNYLTERSFDAYMAQTLQGKAEFISQIFSGRNKQRVMTDAASEMVLSLEEMKIAASGNPDVKLQYDLQMQKSQLQALERNWESQRRSTRQSAEHEAMRAYKYQADIEKLTAAWDKIKAIQGEGEEKGIRVEVDGKTFTERKPLFEHLEAMELPPGNFHMTWNGVGVAVTRRDDLTAEQLKARGMSGLEYSFDYEGRQFNAPNPSMLSLARSIESRLRDVPDELAGNKAELPRIQEKARRLQELSESGTFPEADKLAKVEKELADVERRLGMRSDVENAMSQAVAAEVSSDPEEDLLTEGEDEEEQEEGLAVDDIDEQADAIEKKGQPKPGVTLRASVFGLDLLAEFAVKQGAAFWKADIAPHLDHFGATAKEAAATLAHVLYPRLGANADAQDILGRARGKLEAHLFHLEHLDGGLERYFDKMPQDAQLAFIDRYKLGVGQPTQDLQRIENVMRAIDDRSLRLAQRYKPTLQAKDDHFRVIWKVIPYSGAPAGGKSAQFQRSKRPFQGDKGFMKRATLETISEGINAGGVPVTTNPWKLFTLAQSSIMKYISAQQAWEAAKKLGLRKYVKRGQQPPDGWVKINDRIADVYFPEKALSVDLDNLPIKMVGPRGHQKEWIPKEDIDTHRVMANPGTWYAEPGFARLLNNYLSPDMIRQSAIGSTLMFAKNLTTAIELSLSPFHAIFETIEAIGSQFGLGVQRAWNNGVRLGEGQQATQGMKEIATSIAAPYLLSRAGGDLQKYAENPQQFLQTPRGQKFLQQFPNAPAVLQELFNGGLTWSMQRDFRFDPQKSMLEAAKEGNYVGALLRAVPWVNTVLMKPLFEVYIPRLKWGLALGQYSQQVLENRDALASGEMTTTEIARKVADTVENRFGEMNFNNIYWNNTVKSAFQMMFRSVTWKLGNWRGLGSAVGPEAYQAFRDPLNAMREDIKAGKKQHGAGAYLPKVGMNQAWLIGMAVTTAVIGTVLARFLSHHWPWEWAGDDRENGYSLAGAMALETIHPRTGRVNQYTNKPERISLPTGLRDFEHAYRDPGSYFHGSLSGFAGKAYDTWENRDAFKNYVYDPHGTEYQKLAQIFAYNAPMPISLENWKERYGAKDTESKVLRAAGVGSAGSTLDLSPAEERMRALRYHEPETPEQIKEREAKEEHPTRQQVIRALRSRQLDYAQRMFKGLPYAEARDVYDNYATPEERGKLHHLLIVKRQNLLKREGR